MQLPDILRRRRRDRLERFNIGLLILIAGWVPSVLMLVVSYTILTRTLESKILRDRQTFVQLIAHLVGDDLGRSGEIVDYYQTYPTVAKILTARYPDLAGKIWLQETYFSHPRNDGMFITNADGRLIASLPDDPAMILNDQISKTWLISARTAQRFYVSAVHPCAPDNRLATDLVSAIRAADGSTTGFIGVSVLVERIGRRLSTIDFADQEQCQIIDQNGVALFGDDFKPNPGPVTPAATTLLNNIRARRRGHSEDQGILYSFAPVESTGWTTVIKQPRAVAYKPVRDL